MKRVYAIGIDFGTSNSCICVACYLRRADGSLSPIPIKRPEAVPIQYRDTVPTVVFLGSASEPPVFGEVAEEKALFYPELTQSNFKMRLGAPGADGEDAFHYTCRFLRYLRSQVADSVPFFDSSSEVEIVTCIGHPVQWTPDQRDLTRQAAIEAGFPNVTIDDESSSAIYYHLCEESLSLEPDESARALVIDMGGGTTDFAFVELSGEPGVAPVTTPVDPSRLVPPWGADRHTYGGRDMDDLLLRHIATPWGYTPHSREWSFLLREARRFKEMFSLAMLVGKDSYRAQWVLDGAPHEVRLQRDEFESVAQGYIEHMPRLTQGALALAGLRPEDVDAVILTGGHSRWYWVEAAVQTIFPGISAASHSLLRQRHPDQSVARGLAYKWMIEAVGGRPKPRRRATHAIWIASPESSAHTYTTPPVNLGPSANPVAGTPSDPLLIMDRGQFLPYRTPGPARLSIQKIDFNSGHATLRLKIYSGSSDTARTELADRIATFDRSLWESFIKRITSHLPWSTAYDTDDFDVEVLCSVDENEMFTGQVRVTRFLRGRPAQQQTYMLKMEPSVNGQASPQMVA